MIAVDSCATCARPAILYAGELVCAACDAPAAVCPCRRPDPAPAVPAHVVGPCCDRNEAIAAIRAGLRRRTGRAWSVTGGRGTAWGWIRIQAPPARRVGYGYLSAADAAELGRALGLDRPVHMQGEKIPAGHDYRIEYVDRAEGRAPSRFGVPYWD